MVVLQDRDLLKYNLDGRSSKLILLLVTWFLTEFSTLAPLSATDGKVGALHFLLDKQYFVTSPN